jgi:hypothetical protein
MGRKVNKLFDLEFDEVSSVDRPANQHGLIAFSKSASATSVSVQEGSMTEIYTETGLPVYEDDLEHGDVVFDEEGNEYVWVIQDEIDFSVDKASALTTGGVAENVGSALARRSGGRFNKKAKIAAGAVAGALGVGGAGAYMMNRKDKDVEKSLGDSVLEQLSKAVTEADRESVIAKALDEVEVAKAQAQAAMDELAYLQDQRVTEVFVSKAAAYNLPVAPEVFGPILKAAATVLTDEQLDVLDHVLTAAGDAIYEEIGMSGGASNSILDHINGYASEMVTKSAGDFSLEQASTAMFTANPDAYDAYIAEQNGR